MEEQRIAKSHRLVVNNRKTSTVTGVLDVLSFDLNEILLETEQGMLMVKGTDLHVNRLSVEWVFDKPAVQVRACGVSVLRYDETLDMCGRSAVAAVRLFHV